MSATTTSMKDRLLAEVETKRSPTKRKNTQKNMSKTDKPSNISMILSNPSTSYQPPFKNSSKDTLNSSIRKAKSLKNNPTKSSMIPSSFLAENSSKDSNNLADNQNP